jgi:site-specific recombinase XerD
MKRLFTFPKTIRRMYEGPLGEYIESYVDLLDKQGFSKKTSQQKVRLVADLSRWLEHNSIPIHDLNERMIDRYIKHRKTFMRLISIEQSTFNSLLGMLRARKIIDKEVASKIKVNKTQVESIEEDFKRYLLQERGLTQRTIASYLAHFRRFIFDRFGTKPVQFNRLCPEDITGFVRRYVDELGHSSYVEKVLTALRLFLRYLRYQNEIITDLASCVPNVTKWKFSSLPKFISSEEVQQVLKNCDRQSFIGKRNYAILLLLTRYGLRAGEIAALKFEDIDWENGIITIFGKGGRKDRLPLTHDVGEAIAEYLLRGRPPCSSRCVFVRHKAPIGEFSNYMAISSIAHRALERVGVGDDLPYKGAHLFRHTLATEMLRRGASLGEIGEILRHRSPNTTSIYAKVDLNALKSLVKPWPGGEI